MDRPIKLEPMTADHWASVRSIYLEGIATGNATFHGSRMEGMGRRAPASLPDDCEDGAGNHRLGRIESSVEATCVCWSHGSQHLRRGDGQEMRSRQKVDIEADRRF